ncbi:MAG TPA: hypothetical protein VLH94_00825, partial [Spirochaetia bacterium]|nr:hypothetical protein [Spirochaetia bacterium]
NVDITSKDPLARKLRGEFVEFIKRVAPKNSDGEVIEFPDFEETFKVFQESRKSAPQNNRKKDLASRSMNPSKEVVENKIPTDQSWKAVDKIINKLIG